MIKITLEAYIDELDKRIENLKRWQAEPGGEKFAVSDATYDAARTVAIALYGKFPALPGLFPNEDGELNLEWSDLAAWTFQSVTIRHVDLSKNMPR